jgi:hypothetical protein
VKPIPVAAKWAAYNIAILLLAGWYVTTVIIPPVIVPDMPSWICNASKAAVYGKAVY